MTRRNVERGGGDRIMVDPRTFAARHVGRIEEFRRLHRGGTETFRLRYIIELFYRHRELVDAGCDEEAAAILHELAEAASERDDDAPRSSECVQMQWVWWARALADAQARAQRLQQIVAVVGYAERGCALRRGVPDLVEIDDAVCELLERSHAALLRVRSTQRAALALGDLRRTASLREGDVEAREGCLARALCRVHAQARAAGDHARADAVLFELRRVAARPPNGTPRSVALTDALCSATRHTRGAARAGVLEELREWAEHPCARQESRAHYRDAVTDRASRERPLVRGYRSES